MRISRPKTQFIDIKFGQDNGQEREPEARLKVNEMRMQIWMCGMTRRDKIRNEHIRGTTRAMQECKKITEKRLKWYGHVRKMKEEQIVRRMLDVDIPGKTYDGKMHARET